MIIIKTIVQTIQTCDGIAKYIGTEIEDELGNFYDSYKSKDGYWLIHEGKYHHVYKS